MSAVRIAVRPGASHDVPLLSAWEKVGLVGSLLRLIGTIIPVVLYKFVIDLNFSRRALMRQALRAVSTRISRLPLRYTQYVLPPTGLTVAKFCKKKGLSHETVLIEPGQGFPPATMHFVGCRPDHQDIFLFFHGGGYTFAASAGHVSFAYEAALACKSGLCILEYGLTPHCRYPTQLAQTSATLRHLLTDRSPSQIVIAGDSAGGAMALSLLYHLRKPQPDVTSLDIGETKLRGVLCISARCGTGFGTPSYTYNRKKDILDQGSLDMFMHRWKGTFGHPWCAPIKGEEKLWRDSKEERMLLTVGGDELFYEETKNFARMIGAEEQAGASKQLVLCPGEIHVQAVFDATIGYHQGLMYSAVMSWLATI